MSSPRGFLLHYGDPMPQPRARGRIAGKPPKQWVTFYTPKESTVRRAEFQAAYRGDVLEGPLLLRCIVGFTRPAGHFGSGRNAGILKERCRDLRPVGKGGQTADGHLTSADLDNCVKMVQDALNEVAYADDSQIVRVEAEKVYCDQAGTAEPFTWAEVVPCGLPEDVGEMRLFEGGPRQEDKSVTLDSKTNVVSPNKEDGDGEDSQRDSSSRVKRGSAFPGLE